MLSVLRKCWFQQKDLRVSVNSGDRFLGQAWLWTRGNIEKWAKGWMWKTHYYQLPSIIKIWVFTSQIPEFNTEWKTRLPFFHILTFSKVGICYIKKLCQYPIYQSLPHCNLYHSIPLSLRFWTRLNTFESVNKYPRADDFNDSIRSIYGISSLLRQF